ncbi:MAG TPA: peptidyl-alpha-hydroxyglycine alpha-amidating lyase family protein [Rhizomicrobium sp.]|nr:peptidyl-alpha-hydroxyglycine alpha-amidating lyase family protein [Rhizomicrobium sp.]
MKRIIPALLAATVLFGLPAIAQTDMSFTPADILKVPRDKLLGEVAGVATNSKGDIFVFTRTGDPSVSLGGSRTFQRGGTALYRFDASGKYLGQIGKGLYGFLVAQQVRIDKEDNIWAVDASSGMVMKFDPTGSRIVMLLGRKPESVDVPQPPPRAPRGNALPGQGAPQDLFDQPTDVAWDAQGNIFVADGLGANTRVAKFNSVGKFIKSFGSKGTADGLFADAHSLAVDGSGNVYVADQGNKRIQVFDNDGNLKSQIANVGAPAALCIIGGTLYSSNSNPQNDIDHGGEIYKLSLNGTVTGKFGRAGKTSGEFGTVNEIDCRTPGTLFVAEIGNYRVQKVTLH